MVTRYVLLKLNDAVTADVPHPIHQALVAEVLAPVVAFKKTWNFQEQPSAG